MKKSHAGAQRPFMAAAPIEVIDLIESDEDEREIIEIFDEPSGTEAPETKSDLVFVKSQGFKDKNYPSYYQRAFISILSSVIEVYHRILNQDELDILKRLTEDLSVSAQRLFIRLFLRKAGWQRVNKLIYEDIPSVKEAADELTLKYLCVIESEDLCDYLELMTLMELKSFASSKLFLKVSNSSLQRDELIRTILNSKTSGQQRLFLASTLKSTANTSSKLDIIKQSTGPIIKINDQVRLLIDTVISLYFLVSSNNQESNLSTAILVEINRRSYPKYKIIRTLPIFKSRQEYLEYQKALEMEILLKECVEEGKTIYEYFDDCKRNLMDCLQTCDLERSYFLRRFTAGWVYCRILSYLASNLESIKRYSQAVEIYQILLNQDLFCLGHRGKWWERLILDTSKHLKDREKALELCETALNDPWVRTSALTSIRRRSKRLKKSSDASVEDENEFEDEPEIVTLKGKIQEGNVTGKKVKLHLDGDELSLGTVEQFVLNEFSLDGWEGIHSESSYFTTIFALMLWDLLFDIEIPDVFQTAYQIAPLDLTTDAFYPFRRRVLEERLSLIEEDFEAAIKLLRKHHVSYHQVSCVGVNWTDYAGEEGIELLVKVARGIGGMALSLILRQFCEDYRHNRSGMPDLILWRVKDDRSELIDHANGVILAEVKSPRDRLSDAQRHWFSVLKNGGLRVVLVRVLEDEPGGKPKKVKRDNM